MKSCDPVQFPGEPQNTIIATAKLWDCIFGICANIFAACLANISWSLKETECQVQENETLWMTRTRGRTQGKTSK